MPPTQQSRFLAIETKLGKDKVLLKNFSMNEQLGRLFQMEVELRSEDRAIKFEDIVGTSATVKLKMPNGQTRCFNGVVSRFVQVEHQGSYAVYRATLVPWFWLLTRTADCRIFQNKSVPDIIEQVFKAQGFNDYNLKLSGSYRPWEYCVQYRETDFNFTSRLMEQEGIYYFFEHQDGKHTLVLADSPSAHEPFAGYDTLVYRPPTTRQEENKETVTDWVMEKEIQPGMYAVSAFNFTTPRAAVQGNDSVSRQYQGADYEVFDYPGDFATRTEGEGYAKLRIQELQAQYEILRAQATVRGVASGYKFTLKSHPRSDQNRPYLITGASLQAKAGEYESRNPDQGDFYSCSFTAMPASEPFRAPRTTPKPLIRGPQTAIVVGPSGQKIYTDPNGYGMVKVHFHWDRHDQRDENSSCWVRVSQAWAGKNWGDMALPHVGDEVIVECLEGDPDRPIITGRVYNATNMPPMTLPANQNKRVLADDYGNQLVFDATPGDEHIILRSPHHKSGIVLGRSTTKFTIGNDISGTEGNSIDLRSGTSISATAGAEVYGTFGTKLELTGGQSFDFLLGTNLEATLGPDLSFSKGYKHESTGSEDTSVCSQDMILGAGDTLCLMGGLGHTDGTSIISASNVNFHASVGEKKGDAPGPQINKVAMGFMIASIVLTTATSGVMMGCEWDFANSAEEGEKKGDVNERNTALRNQHILEGFVDVVQLVSLITNIICSIKAEKEAANVGKQNHATYAAKISLNTNAQAHDEGTAKLEANKEIDLNIHNPTAQPTAKITLNKDKKISIAADSTGEIDIQVGTTGVKIVDNKITITGTQVKIAGSFDVDGALTVQGGAIPMVDQLATQVAALNAKETELSAKFAKEKLASDAMRKVWYASRM